MLGRLKNEETETKTHSLCLFNVPGITRRSNQRCDNCPSATRTPLYDQKGCPLDSLEYNIFNPAGAAAKSWKCEVDSNSSKTLQHGEDAVTTKIADFLLNGSTGRKFVQRTRNELGAGTYHELTEEVQNAKSNKLGAVFPVEGYSDTGAELMQNKHLKSFQEPLVEELIKFLLICSVSSPVHMQEEHHAEGDMSMSMPHVNIAVKLKAADILNWPKHSLRTELAGCSSLKASVHTGVNERAIEFRDGSSDVKEYLQNKPQNIFQDLQRDEPLFLEGSLTGVPALWSSLMKYSDDNPNDMQEDHTLGKDSSSSICVPGFGMITDRQGVRTYYDRILNENDQEKNVLMAMDLTEEPSIDQMELGIERSFFF